MLKWTSKLAVLGLAISVWASPLMACMLPGGYLTVEERACCKHMADNCGQMTMPASHSCCKVVVRQADSYLLNSRFSAVHSITTVTLFGAAIDDLQPASRLQAHVTLVGHSPPTSPPETISILRI